MPRRNYTAASTYCDEDGYVELGADMPHTFWTCRACEAHNSCEDGECQFCDCGGAECLRDNCDAPEHGCVVESKVGRS